MKRASNYGLNQDVMPFVSGLCDSSLVLRSHSRLTRGTWSGSHATLGHRGIIITRWTVWLLATLIKHDLWIDLKPEVEKN
jgi:hypothetical protein